MGVVNEVLTLYQQQRQMQQQQQRQQQQPMGFTASQKPQGMQGQQLQQQLSGQQLPGGLQPAQGGISQQTQEGTCNYYDSVSVDHSHIGIALFLTVGVAT